LDIVMPQLDETVRDTIVSVWHKKVGDAVQIDEPLFEVEVDDVTIDIQTPAAGVLAQILVPAGGKAVVGARVAVLWTDPAEEVPARSVAIPSTTASTVRIPNPAARFSPVVRKLLAEHDIDAADITGTGTEGRITRDDVLAYLDRRGGVVPPAETVIAMNRIRRVTAEHVTRSVATSPHVLQAVEVDFVAIDRLRAAASGAWRAREGFSLTYLPFVARAVCRALVEFPHVNASVRGDKLVVHHRVNLGIAVDLDRDGLVVPVIKDAADRPARELARAIRQLVERARRGALAPDELVDGTYTISSSGASGMLITTPIIVQPQVAILSIDAVRKRPVVVERADGDAIEIRPVGVLAQRFDQRAFDGAYAAAFLRRVKDLVERADFAAELDVTPGAMPEPGE
jgi:2-oxoglutarate dehydrogenase E2 component (dihydrolipoamide succinyltransferase)